MQRPGRGRAAPSPSARNEIFWFEAPGFKGLDVSPRVLGFRDGLVKKPTSTAGTNNCVVALAHTSQDKVPMVPRKGHEPEHKLQRTHGWLLTAQSPPQKHAALPRAAATLRPVDSCETCRTRVHIDSIVSSMYIYTYIYIYKLMHDP